MVRTKEEGLVFQGAVAELSTEQQLHHRQGCQKALGFLAAKCGFEAQGDVALCRSLTHTR